jgi:hypothetical protein
MVRQYRDWIDKQTDEDRRLRELDKELKKEIQG